MANQILDPTGRGAQGDGPVAGLSPRPGSLAGLRVGLLDNTKHNAALFLTELGEMLSEQYGMSVGHSEVKRNFSVPVDEDIIGRFRGECDVVVTAIGDCGSCSAAAVADGIAFEKAGIPAAVVLTDAFTVTGETMAQVQGYPGYEWLVTKHPVAVLTPEQIRDRVTELLPGIVSTLSGAKS